MGSLEQPRFTRRYEIVTEDKAAGATYTPKLLADFVARKVIAAAGTIPADRPLRVLDPAMGTGELLLSLLDHLADHSRLAIELYGFETNAEALYTAKCRLGQQFPDASLGLEQSNFLDFVLDQFGTTEHGHLFCRRVPETYDIIIANPPYIRTQIIGAAQSRLLAAQFGLSGRVDLYYAFILAMSQVLSPQGVAGIIVSNRFMSTKSGAPVRQGLLERFGVLHVWDLGDTKLFEAAVLPAVLLVKGKNSLTCDAPAFTSIYQTPDPATRSSANPITALDNEGTIKLDDGRHFHVQHGRLSTSGAPNGVWRIATESVDAWLTSLEINTWGIFRDIGKIRVGVKTCADKIFIRNDWQEMPDSSRPELLRPLITHHVGRRFKALDSEVSSQILYPHEVIHGRRCVADLACYPRSQAYLEAHRATLESRKYVIDAGREWYEIWVPQDPDSWRHPKLVFRDIADKPTFWVDLDGSIVNGDCYWIVCQSPADTDLLWLAASVGNSTFIERFYDLRFHNKLYAGRRRFITQYVEQFPLPDPISAIGKAIIEKAKRIYQCIPSLAAERLQGEVNTMVWEALTGTKPANEINGTSSAA